MSETANYIDNVPIYDIDDLFESMMSSTENQNLSPIQDENHQNDEITREPANIIPNAEDQDTEQAPAASETQEEVQIEVMEPPIPMMLWNEQNTVFPLPDDVVKFLTPQYRGNYKKALDQFKQRYRDLNLKKEWKAVEEKWLNSKRLLHWKSTRNIKEMDSIQELELYKDGLTENLKYPEGYLKTSYAALQAELKHVEKRIEHSKLKAVYDRMRLAL